MPRVIWKGAISFGLVHVPVALYPAASEDDIDFDWLDRRSMDPVGYKRINKRTGREIRKEDIVRGVKQEDGAYVVLSDEDIRAAYPRTTQTIGIEAFVTAQEIPFLFLERPYYLEPIGKSAKVYALLREALLAEGCIGIARVVMHSKEHLAALIPSGPALLLNTLRWPDEIRPWNELVFPAQGRSAAGLKDAELKMARQLVGELRVPFKPKDYADHFRDAILKLVRQKAEAGETEQVTPIESADAAAAPSNIVDLTQLLRQSLGQRKGAGMKAQTTGRAPRAAARTMRKTAPARKRA